MLAQHRMHSEMKIRTGGRARADGRVRRNNGSDVDVRRRRGRGSAVRHGWLGNVGRWLSDDGRRLAVRRRGVSWRAAGRGVARRDLRRVLRRGRGVLDGRRGGGLVRGRGVRRSGLLTTVDRRSLGGVLRGLGGLRLVAGRGLLLTAVGRGSLCLVGWRRRGSVTAVRRRGVRLYI